MSTLLANLDLDRLSPKTQAIKIALLDPIQDGWKETEIAVRLGRTPSWVSERLSELRSELFLQQDIFPPLTDVELDSLRTDVAARGILVPIIVDHDLRVIDGRYRLIVANELGFDPPYVLLPPETTEEQKQEIRFAANMTRRQMNRQQKRDVARTVLQMHAHWPDRRVAAICGVSPPLVAEVRAELVEQDELLNNPSQEIIDQHEDAFTNSKLPVSLGKEVVKDTRPPREGSDGVWRPLPSAPIERVKVDELVYAPDTSKGYTLHRADGNRLAPGPYILEVAQ